MPHNSGFSSIKSSTKSNLQTSELLVNRTDVRCQITGPAASVGFLLIFYLEELLDIGKGWVGDKLASSLHQQHTLQGLGGIVKCCLEFHR